MRWLQNPKRKHLLFLICMAHGQVNQIDRKQYFYRVVWCLYAVKILGITMRQLNSAVKIIRYWLSFTICLECVEKQRLAKFGDSWCTFLLGWILVLDSSRFTWLSTELIETEWPELTDRRSIAVSLYRDQNIDVLAEIKHLWAEQINKWSCQSNWEKTLLF